MKTEVACYEQDCAFHTGEFECTSDIVIIGKVTRKCQAFVEAWEDKEQAVTISTTNLPKS